MAFSRILRIGLSYINSFPPKFIVRTFKNAERGKKLDPKFRNELGSNESQLQPLGVLCKNPYVLVFPSQDFLAVDPKPLIEDRCIYLTEIDGMLEIAHL